MRRLFEDGAGKGQSRVDPKKARLLSPKSIRSFTKLFGTGLKEPGFEDANVNDAPVTPSYRKNIRQYLKSTRQKRPYKLTPRELGHDLHYQKQQAGNYLLHQLNQQAVQGEDLLGAVTSGRVSITEVVDHLLEASRRELERTAAREKGILAITNRQHGSLKPQTKAALTRRGFVGADGRLTDTGKSVLHSTGFGSGYVDPGQLRTKRNDSADREVYAERSKSILGKLLQGKLATRVEDIRRRAQQVAALDEGLGSFVRKAKRVGRAGAFMAGLTGPMVGLGAWNAGRDRMPAHVLRAAQERAEVIKSFKMPEAWKGLRRSKNIEVRQPLTLQQMRDMGDRESKRRIDSSIKEAALDEVFINLGKPRSQAGKKPTSVKIGGQRLWNPSRDSIRSTAASRNRDQAIDDREFKRVTADRATLGKGLLGAATWIPGPIGIGATTANMVRAGMPKKDPNARQWPLTPKPGPVRRLGGHLRDVLRSEKGHANVLDTLRMARAGLF